MATALFTDAELLCFDHDIITISEKLKTNINAQILIVFTKRSSKFQTIMTFPRNSSTFELKTF